jgi:16S rRNA (uracil1498-N3)-methyltransferase
MARTDFASPRLFIDAPLAEGVRLPLSREHANYLLNVLRLGEGARLLVFNGRDGEFATSLRLASRKSAALAVGARLRPQETAPDLDYLFAPLKHARLDYMAQKAVEMGASRLQPVLTRHGQVTRVSVERMRANAIEAAEQCGIMTLPEIRPPLSLEQAIAALEPERVLVFCDEAAPVKDPIGALAQARKGDQAEPLAVAVLIGPEGGFAAEERAALLRVPNAVRLSLGPRVLRADTAAVAALALVGAVLGDWR